MIQKLYVTDYGAPEVGIRACYYEIDVPFETEEVPSEHDLQDLNEFREDILKIYREYANGKLVAYFDFELKQEEK